MEYLLFKDSRIHLFYSSFGSYGIRFLGTDLDYCGIRLMAKMPMSSILDHSKLRTSSLMRGWLSFLATWTSLEPIIRNVSLLFINTF
jgi:hypothetical protein